MHPAMNSKITEITDQSGLPGQPRQTDFRPNGLLVLLILVGIGSSLIVLYRYMEPRLAADLQAKIESAPRTPEGRVEKWLIFGHPQIDTCIRLLRMSEEQDWIVSHLVAEENGPPQIYGLDIQRIEEDYLVRKGTRIEIWLPEPTLLGRAELIGRNASRVPIFKADDKQPVAEERLRDMLDWRMRDVLKHLKSDIPEVEIEFMFGPVPRDGDATSE